jgi:hypothetical protein
MKKLAFAVVVLALSNLSFAAGCWQNGKYVQCVKNIETSSDRSVY